MLSKGDSLEQTLKMKEYQNIFYANGKQKELGWFYSDKIGFISKAT